MRGGAFIRSSWLASLTALVLLCVPAGASAAESMAVRPDGRILLLGWTYPAFGAIAQLNADGSVDPSFGKEGFLVDQRLPDFAAPALQPDGRILAGAAGGSVLARYLADGAPDPSFGVDGIGGAPEPNQSHSYFRHPYDPTNPVVVKVQPGGTIAMADSPPMYFEAEAGREARVRRYDAHGDLLETVGRLPRASSVALADLLEEPGGALIGAGWATVNEKGGGGGVRPVLARFLPGSGADFDPSFGDAAAVRPDLGDPEFVNRFEAIAAVGDKLLLAGQVDRTFLLARFDQGGDLDPSFGEGGFVAPEIVGPAEGSVPGWEEPKSWAHDMAVAADGDIVLGGGTTQWGDWYFSKVLPECGECTNPMLARFDAEGHLDPGFGKAGLLRLAKPDGEPFGGQIDQVVALADGKLLVAGRIVTGPWSSQPPFVARLQADGSYDAGFGDGGLVIPEFPCTVQSVEQRKRDGCRASATMTLRLRGLRRGSPALAMEFDAEPEWARIETIFLDLPRGVVATPRLDKRTRITVDGKASKRGFAIDTSAVKRVSDVMVNKFGKADRLRIVLRRGSLRTFGRQRLRRRSLRLKVSVHFRHATWETDAGQQTVVQRVTGHRGP